ncbi:MarR family winged helix-turn-helix transcriptional regulator [Aurantiacibacter rhizosphaerae]|uniref:MarR family transcriptional regulator n=1 Tax=Aurantiacibacter rhizosphaerae TaxID=2691582 RepID=A0A844XHP0_9SPHN|nr:MarR family transcriptional regulator [Aurantiacibacter rhizosphaerae]MWV29068.1 MarR family transcriptional regulator [Aurantiacibacter rhizosphaerae]
MNSAIDRMLSGKSDQLSYKDWPFYWLTRAHGRYIDALNSALEDSRLDPTEWRVIMVLQEDQWISVSELASQGNTKLSTMTKAVKRMEREGLVTLREGLRDRRVTEVCLTRVGHNKMADATQAAAHVYRRAFMDMSVERVVLLREMLTDLAENLR